MARSEGVVDEARAAWKSSLAGRIRALPFAGRMGAIYCLGFAFGAVVETFACQTRLYEAVAHKKAQRRHEIDEGVAELQENIQKWQDEDMKLATAAAAVKQQQSKA
jgi:hypothetical protein